MEDEEQKREIDEEMKKKWEEVNKKRDGIISVLSILSLTGDKNCIVELSKLKFDKFENEISINVDELKDDTKIKLANIYDQFTQILKDFKEEEKI